MIPLTPPSSLQSGIRLVFILRRSGDASPLYACTLQGEFGNMLTRHVLGLSLRVTASTIVVSVMQQLDIGYFGRKARINIFP